MQQKASDDINFYFSFTLIGFYNADTIKAKLVSISPELKKARS